MIIFEHGLLVSTGIRIDCYGTGRMINARSGADNELNAAGRILVQAWLDRRKNLIIFYNARDNGANRS
jgi:hypothetical protein